MLYVRASYYELERGAIFHLQKHILKNTFGTFTLSVTGVPTKNTAHAILNNLEEDSTALFVFPA